MAGSCGDSWQRTPPSSAASAADFSAFRLTQATAKPSLAQRRATDAPMPGPIPSTIAAIAPRASASPRPARRL